MKIEFEVINADEIEMEMTIRMPLGQWTKLREQLEGEWPAFELRSKITDMVNHANAHFYPKTD